MIRRLRWGVGRGAGRRSANERASPSAVPTKTENSKRQTCSAARIVWSGETRWDAVSSRAMSISSVRLRSPGAAGATGAIATEIVIAHLDLLQGFAPPAEPQVSGLGPRG